MPGNCPLCDNPMHDPQIFYVCASNARSENSTTLYRLVAIESRCCLPCHRRMKRYEMLAYSSAAFAALLLIATLLLSVYKVEWFTRTYLFWSLLVVVAAAVLAGLAFRPNQRVGDPPIQAVAEHIAHSLDLEGTPAVFVKASKPAGPCLIVALDPSESDS